MENSVQIHEEKHLTVANVATMIRLTGGATAFFWFDFDSVTTMIIFCALALTDFEGVWARWRNATSSLGEELDPIADKVLVNIPLILIAVHYNQFSIWLLAVLTIGYDIDNTRRRFNDIRLAWKKAPSNIKDLPVSAVSKWKTAVLFVTVLLLISTDQTIGPFEFERLFVEEFDLVMITQPVVFIATALVIISWWSKRRETFARWLNLRKYKPFGW